MTGTVVSIIHSGLLPDSINDSINFNLLIVLSSATFDLTSLSIALSLSLSDFRSKLINNSLIASAPIDASKAFSPYSSWNFIYSSSESSCFFLSFVKPGSVTRKLSKYRTFSTSLSFILTANDILLGRDFKNHIWATGQANSICPILSLLTLDLVTSTPHFSQIIPLNFILLYLPHKHS